ncbi:MAG: aminotransferase class V-fold PLP-dependent enzyme, partial [Lachnospiraceae bacterium]|nr:aminotransferase class V-fold PLP-dependent enzyme [Lachnospiraceae bacterium]
MSEGRIFNFSAGPSMLPEPVLKRVQSELMNYEGCGMSVMEMSHRSKVYDKIITDCEANLRKVLGVPDNYKVLFLQGGASGIFCALPMNLCGTNKKADYIVSGNFSGGALKEAKKFLGDGAQEAGTTKDLNFTRVPTQDELKLDPEAAYVHVCYNNTIYGTKWHYDPETGDVPLIADMSSCILSEP